MNEGRLRIYGALEEKGESGRERAGGKRKRLQGRTNGRRTQRPRSVLAVAAAPPDRESGAHSERVFPLHPVRSLPLSASTPSFQLLCQNKGVSPDYRIWNYFPLHLSSFESWGERMEHIIYVVTCR